MPRLDYKRCKGCGRHTSECGPLSHKRLCGDCGQRRFVENIVQLQAHSGPFAVHHRRQCVAAWGGVLLDDGARSAQTGQR